MTPRDASPPPSAARPLRPPPSPLPAWRRLAGDPRHFQVAVLASLLAWGIWGLDLEVLPAVAVTVLLVAQGTQWIGTRWVRWRSAVDLRFDVRSALISALSLTLLLRTPSLAVAALAAAVAIGGKFLVRVRGKHVFNPANLGIVVALLVSDRAWVSPGQWGSAAVGAFALACLGFVVVRRAERSDVTWAFLAFYGALVSGRALWLGDPLAIPLHHLSSGAFLVFAFFMISDPKTTPDSRAGRVLFALLVALGAGFVHFVLYRPNGLIWSLVVLAPLVPLIDLLLPGRKYAWPGTGVATPDRSAPRSFAPGPATPGPAVPGPIVSGAPAPAPAASAATSPALPRSTGRRPAGDGETGNLVSQPKGAFS